MDEKRYEAMMQRMAALEARIVVLEGLLGEPGGARTQALLERYPKGMSKTEAANELGVTRATIYAMLADGRIKENGMGRVLTQSVADLMYSNRIEHNKRRRGNRWPLRMGADNE